MRVFRLDRAGVLARLRERARALVARHEDVLEMRLFGSLARGEGHPGSDADVIVVVRDGAGPFLERIPRFAAALTGIGIGCDVLVYTDSERQALLARNDRFAREALTESVLLAGRDL